MKKGFPIFAIIMGLYWTVMGFKYGFWIRKGPGGGFFPVVAGILAIILGIWVFVSRSKDKEVIKFNYKALIPILGIAALLLVSYVTGFIIAIAVYISLWLKFMEKYKTSKSLIIGVCTSAVIYGIFIAWLQVPLPKGLFGIF